MKMEKKLFRCLATTPMLRLQCRDFNAATLMLLQERLAVAGEISS